MCVHKCVCMCECVCEHICVLVVMQVHMDIHARGSHRKPCHVIFRCTTLTTFFEAESLPDLEHIG